MELLCVHSVNEPRVFAAARRILNARTGLAPEAAADAAFDLERVAPRRAQLNFEVPWLVRRPGWGAQAWGHS